MLYLGFTKVVQLACMFQLHLSCFTHKMWMMILHQFLLVYISDLISDDGIYIDFITNSMVYNLYYTVIHIAAILL